MTRTQKWLHDVVVPHRDRVLFLITVNDEVVGHIGLCHVTEKKVELDNAIIASSVTGLFQKAEYTLLDFVFTVLEIDIVFARAFSHNKVHVLHRYFGFESQVNSFLKKMERPNGDIIFEECSEIETNVNFQCVTIELMKEKFIHKFK